MRSPTYLPSALLRLVALAAVIGPTIMAVPASAAVTEAWVRRYSESNNQSNDKTVSVAHDSAGNIIVVGDSDDGTDGLDMLTIKYSAADGSVLWQRRYNNPSGGSFNADEVRSMAVDGHGNVVVTGRTRHEGQGDNWYTAKYAATDGSLVWEKETHLAALEECEAIAVDGGGDIIFLGGSYDGTNLDRHVVKYAGANGDTVWSQVIRSTQSSGSNALAVDGGGNVVVNAVAFLGNNEAGFPEYGRRTIKYSSIDGLPLWENSTTEFSETSLAVDAAGDVVLGSARGCDENGNCFYYLAKHAAADGEIEWEKNFTDPWRLGGEGEFSSLAMDGSGNVALLRTVGNALNRPDYHTAKYAAADGSLIWEKQYGGPDGFSDHTLRAMTVDGGGNMVVTGGLMSPRAGGGFQTVAWTARYAAADGALLWEQRSSTPAVSAVLSRSVIADAGGNVAVAGTYNSDGSQFGNDFYTARYAAPNGAILWERLYDVPANSDDFAHAVAMDAAGNVIVAGAPATIKYCADGTIAWTRPGAAGMLAVDAPGNVVVTGMGTIKYRADGTTAWSIPDSMKVMTLDAAGNVFHAGDTSDAQHPGHSRAKYAAANGALLWKLSHNGPSNSYFSATAAAVDAGGNVIVTGTTGSTDDGLDYYTAKYAGSDGALLWEKRFDGARANDVATAVALDGTGNVVVTGYSKNGFDDQFNYWDSDYHTVKYSAADGALLWQKRFDSFDYGDDRANVVAVDAAGNVVVTGSSAEGAGDWYGPTVSYTAKYAAADGALIWENRDLGGAASAMALDPGGNVVITGVSGRIESYTFAAGTNFHTAKYAAADGSFIWRRSSPAPGAYHLMGFWDVLFPIPRGEGNSHSLALGPNGRIAITGSSDGNSGPDAIFDYETIVYQETAGPVSFAAWAASFGPGGNDLGTADDPDFDGLPNAVEYVLGENPLVPASSGRPAATLSGDSMLFTFPRNDAAETPDVYFSVETSGDLITWSTGVHSWPALFFIGQNTATSSLGVTIAENGSAPDSVTVAVPLGPGATKYARLRVTITP